MSEGRYEVLHYRGDLTQHEELQPGRVFGHDEIGRPYEVLDVEFVEDSNLTDVNLQYAGQEALKAEVARREAEAVT